MGREDSAEVVGPEPEQLAVEARELLGQLGARRVGPLERPGPAELLERAGGRGGRPGERGDDPPARVGGPGEGFAATVGARVTQTDVGSVLDVSTMNPGSLSELATPDPAYEIVQWRDRCPDELVDRFAVARTAMNDAPHGDEPHDDWGWDAARVRALEERRVRWQVRTYTTVAVHVDSGEVGGFTDLLIVDRPTTASQEDTGVIAAHRGHGLGLSVKAANLLSVLEHEPQIRQVMTWNAEGNRHMRAVNERLGFRVANKWLDLSLKI